MRVTIDLDTKNLFYLLFSITKGIILLRKMPSTIRRSSTRRGFHIIWRNTNLTQKETLRYRYIIGDDKKRIELDFKCKKRITQILFTRKKIFKINKEEDKYAIQKFIS